MRPYPHPFRKSVAQKTANPNCVVNEILVCRVASKVAYVGGRRYGATLVKQTVPLPYIVLRNACPFPSRDLNGPKNHEAVRIYPYGVSEFVIVPGRSRHY